ncbi:hypothetical protein ACFYOG_06775 [Streptomyces sp. NPDC007818]|uniref:hypothetical protein n=1 Tax=Streptomyces sp. NPDC007818 TaxID=3364780 RepID=UPI0036A861B1
MPLTSDTQRFAALSARLTGFDEATLEATGLTEEFRATAAERLGPGIYARLLREAGGPGESVGDTMDREVRDAARQVAYLWYTGGWPGSQPVVTSARAYAEALAWKAAGLTAPATDPGGYGSWAGASGRPIGRDGGDSEEYGR